MGRVARRVIEADVASRVVVSTDHQEIARAARAAGAEVLLDRAAYRSGTDRVAAAFNAIAPGADAVLNVQGDEPLVDRPLLEAALRALAGNAMGTVAVPLSGADLDDPDTVKVVLAGERALDFSRRPLDGASLAHVGIYSFTPASLRRFAKLSTSAREREEGLEQLRFLQAAQPIGVAVVGAVTAAVNRPEDVDRVERLAQTLTRGN